MNAKTRLAWLLHDGEQAELADRWADAVEAYRSAQELCGQLYTGQTTYLHAERQLGLAPDLASRLAVALCCVNRREEALIALESSRGRLIGALVGTGAMQLGGLRALGRRDLADRLEGVIVELRRYEFARARPDFFAPDGLTDRVHQLQMYRDVLLAEARQISGFGNLLGSPTVAEMRRAAAGISMVWLCAGSTRGVGLIVPADPGAELVVVPLPTITGDAVGRWASELIDADADLDRDPRCSFERIDACCRWLGDALGGPLSSAAELLGRAPAFIPCGWLALLPLAAAWCPRLGGRHYLLDDMQPTITHSIQSLAAIRLRPRQAGPVRALVVADPQPTLLPALPEARREAERVAELLPRAQQLIGSNATRAAALSALPGCTVLHLATHGSIRTGLRSGLIFAYDEWWEAQDMAAANLSAGPLVVLSACQTAAIGRTAPDEVLGMPAALLAAGAQDIVGSLWAVADDSTGLLMAQFYAELGDPSSGSPGIALAAAQVWLRDATAGELGALAPNLALSGGDPEARPYAHPYYWAAFSHIGVPRQSISVPHGACVRVPT